MSREEYMARLSQAYERIAANGGRIEAGQRRWEDAWDEQIMAVDAGAAMDTSGRAGGQEEWEEED